MYSVSARTPILTRDFRKAKMKKKMVRDEMTRSSLAQVRCRSIYVPPTQTNQEPWSGTPGTFRGVAAGGRLGKKDPGKEETSFQRLPYPCTALPIFSALRPRPRSSNVDYAPMAS